jgi:hypothetical protein
MWSEPKVVNLRDRSLLPLEAKALHVIGTIVQILNAVGKLLYPSTEARPYADYYLYAYLLACTAIELFGRCQTGYRGFRSVLKEGLNKVGLETVTVNVVRNGTITGYTYDADMLAALRNLVAHGQAIASDGGTRKDVILHVELLDTFPAKLAASLDSYFEVLFISTDPTMRTHLAHAAIEPVLYSETMGQVPYIPPIKVAYEIIYQLGKRPSQALTRTDWQLYNPDRDDRL